MSYELYNNAKDIILYTAWKIREFYDIADFERNAKYYINDYCRYYLKIDVRDNDINNFYAIHNKEIIHIVRNRKQLYKQYREYDVERDEFVETDDELDKIVSKITSYRELINDATKELMEKVFKNKHKLSLTQVRKLEAFNRIQDNDIINIYNKYSKEWEATKLPSASDEQHPEKLVVSDEIHKETFNSKLKKYVIEHMNDNLLTFEDFKRLIRGWNRGRKSLNECYENYKNLYFKQPGTTIQYAETKDTGLIGYKSPDKIEVLKRVFPKKQVVNNTVKASFNLKSNIKRYQLHKCASRNTWIIDLMYCDKLCYLVAINVNTKYLYVELMNDKIDINKFSKKDIKSTFTYLRTLDRMINKGMNVKHLIGDGEMAFNSREARDAYYNSKGIDFKPVPRQIMGVYPEFMQKERNAAKTDPLHGSLGIIDRVIRTIRDIAYNMKIGIITPNIMSDIVKQYNNSPHKGLSKWAGFSVSPKMVNDDPDLENYIVRKINQENYNVMNKPGFKINVGTNVKVYNEKDTMNKRRAIIQPGSFIVNGFKNGLYEVEGNVNGKNKTQMVPRYKLGFI
ncbi:hypothetical protein M9Y10_032167 [Tritrichomonas musculus]|uniref:Integrase catalytic domain-containing protein n=1 Tax=Tritrichomonas musculus TaxID=1915356 RepID=A0ABR2H020_9EUKA